eukprot:539497-Amorphochlora_amoeboformis.AAC.2
MTIRLQAKTRGSAQGGIENPLVRKLKDLYDQLANTNDLSLIGHPITKPPFRIAPWVPRIFFLT